MQECWGDIIVKAFSPKAIDTIYSTDEILTIKGN